MLKYTPLTNVATKNKYEVYIAGNLTLTTFNKIEAQMECEMSWADDAEVKLIRVAK